MDHNEKRKTASSEVGLTRVETRKSKKRINSRTGGSAESSEVEDMSIQALFEGAVSGALKGVKTGGVIEKFETVNHRRDACRPDYRPSHPGD